MTGVGARFNSLPLSNSHLPCHKQSQTSLQGKLFFPIADQSYPFSSWMEQFRQIGEALGSLKAIMVFRDNIQINQRQCCLLMDVFTSAYDSIAEEMKQNLRFEEKQVKWRIIEHPLREVHRIFKEGEGYIRQCLETKDWWAKAIMLYQNADCVEFYIHNLLTSMPIVIEAIETAGEFSGLDQEEMHKKRFVYANKYRKEWRDPELFRWKFAKQYLITKEFNDRFQNVFNEDRWILLNRIRKKKTSETTKLERQLSDLFMKSLEEQQKLLPSSVLVGAKDYMVRRRLGSGSKHKEIIWHGESFELRHFFGDIEPLIPEISFLISLSHPNILQPLCGFTDEEKKECFLVTELMSKDLGNYIKEICGPRKRIVPFTLPVAIDIMLQIARGMEYLHSKKICHGHLNPYKILVKPRSNSPDGYLHAKISAFRLASLKSFTPKSPSIQDGSTLPFIWYPPEVLEDQEQNGSTSNSKFTEKSDVYSFGMVCFELLTGKVPFDDSHLQGDKMSRNIRAGERPLFPLNPPKYVANLTKRCWHTDPNQRPTFASICRILRYTKRFLWMNPDYNRDLDPPMPVLDYAELESTLSRKFPGWDLVDPSQIAEIPFQMFVFRVVEKERTRATLKETSESGSEVSGDETTVPDDSILSSTDRKFSMSAEFPIPERKSSLSAEFPIRKPIVTKRWQDTKPIKPGTPKARARPPQLVPCGRNLATFRTNSEANLLTTTSPRVIRRMSSGHASDSEIS